MVPDELAFGHENLRALEREAVGAGGNVAGAHVYQNRAPNSCQNWRLTTVRPPRAVWCDIRRYAPPRDTGVNDLLEKGKAADGRSEIRGAGVIATGWGWTLGQPDGQERHGLGARSRRESPR